MGGPKLGPTQKLSTHKGQDVVQSLWASTNLLCYPLSLVLASASQELYCLSWSGLAHLLLYFCASQSWHLCYSDALVSATAGIPHAYHGICVCQFDSSAIEKEQWFLKSSLISPTHHPCNRVVQQIELLAFHCSTHCCCLHVMHRSDLCP